MSVSPGNADHSSHNNHEKSESQDPQPPSTVSSSNDIEADGDAQEEAPPQKRRSGRKLLYATSEERKQRNRQAQAAFRERRTEYIKVIEVTLKENEETIEALRQSERGALDECQNLRNKNSLLEQILVDRGIDIQAELQSSGEGPLVDGRRVSGSPKGPAPISQRAIMNRHQQAHLPQGVMPKIEQGADGPPLQSVNLSPQASPVPHPHSTSHLESPSGGYRNGALDAHSGRMQVHSGIQMQQTPHNQQHLPPHYSQSSYPPPHPNQVSAYQQAPHDVSSYHYPEVAGLHTPTSIDEGPSSYQSTMNQNTMNRLGKLPHPFSSSYPQ